MFTKAQIVMFKAFSRIFKLCCFCSLCLYIVFVFRVVDETQKEGGIIDQVAGDITTIDIAGQFSGEKNYKKKKEKEKRIKVSGDDSSSWPLNLNVLTSMYSKNETRDITVHRIPDGFFVGENTGSLRIKVNNTEPSKFDKFVNNVKGFFSFLAG
ncbi:hypothetical protein F9L33_12060 [Amylibacter sp. SFDW26]|uniref:hypothetical protein n=1 Tax=Amylibacter sp. SFDW26 TaxID=2652722 RepID=UPI0012626079|nr:hypothetical protein [Amylibacter sp. SFDW26]KAB7613331.1 hypothetical protein F9L33_12060 [Amylibacter sp. SFDW26]